MLGTHGAAIFMVRAHISILLRSKAEARYLPHTALGLFTASLAYTRSKVAANRIESRRVAELVQIALDTLRNQELAHYTDPVTAPTAFLSPIHLRDSILQEEHSVSARRRLWDKVERVVEHNANVRTNTEMLLGDETRVWRWVGSAGGAGPGKRRVSWSPRVAEEEELDEDVAQ